MDARGTSRLEPEQQRELEAKFGQRYVQIEDGVVHVGSNRKQRRARKRRRRDLG